MQDMQPNLTPDNGPDREGAMAKADLYKLATYSLKLFKKMQDEDQLEAWVQAKITKAADYMASVYHYLEYEMKFSEYAHQLDNAEITAESREILKSKLMEAKSKVKELKKAQAEKVDEATVIGGGKEATCHECGGTGLIMSQGKVVPAHVQSKVDAYKRLTKATHAASKRLDRNNNGIPDHLEDDDVGEGFEADAKVGSKKKTATGELTKTNTGVVHKNTSYADGGDDDIAQRSGKGKKSHAKSQSAAEKKDRAPAQKQSPKSAKTWGMKDNEKFDNRDGAPAKPKKEKEVDETYGQGVYEAKGKKPDFLDMDKDGDKKEPMKKAVADKKAGPKKGVNPFAKKTNEALKGGQKKLDVDDDGDIEADDLADLRAKKDKKVDEAEMTKAGKGVMKYGKTGMQALAKAGREGKSLEPVKAKYNKYDETMSPPDGATAPPPKGKDGQYPVITSGPNKGKRWSPNAPGPTNPAFKESAEFISESADLTRMKEFLTRLNG